MATKINNKDALTITRWFDAPRERVWKAWTSVELMKKWWGPKFFTAPVIKTDLRVGGKYHFSMRGPDGKDYWSTGVYREIVPPERLVLTDSFADENGNVVPASHYGMTGDWPAALLITVTFEELGGRTKLTDQTVFQTVEDRDGMLQEGMEEGVFETMDRLAELLSKAKTEKKAA